MVVVAIVTALFPHLFQLVTPLLGLPAVFAVLADGFVQVPLRLFNTAMTPVVVAVYSPDWHCAAQEE
jgi:hypothetical protein